MTQQVFEPPALPNQHRHRYRKLSVIFKHHVIDYAQRHITRASARQFGLDSKVVRSWIGRRAVNEDRNQQRTRFRSSRDRVDQCSVMEVQLYDYVMDERAAGRCVTCGMIRAEALRLLPNTNCETSNGWLTRFLRRKHLSFRRITTSVRDLPSNAGENVRAFLGMWTPFLEPGIDRDTLLNGDETTICIEPPTTATLAPIGSRKELKQSQVANDIEEIMDDLDFTDDGDLETQAIIDSSEGDAMNL